MKQKNEDESAHKLRRWIVIFCVAVLLIFINCIYFLNKVSSNHALTYHYTLEGDPMEQYRSPAVAGLFYPADALHLEKEITHYLAAGYKKHESMPRVIIVPHAGYRYSAAAAAQAYQPLQDYASQIRTVILLGPSHYVAINGAALSDADFFQTPLGKVKVNLEIVKKLAQTPSFSINKNAHRKEHSIEVQLPFLQKTLRNFDIVPIVYGDINPQQLAEILYKYLRRSDVLLVVSADLSHYHDYGTALEMDSTTADNISERQADIDYHHSCGAAGINTALLLSKKLSLKPEILALFNSGDVSDDKKRVVGYGAWSFSDKGVKISELEREYAGLKSFASQYREQMLDAARRSISAAVNNQTYRPSRNEYDEHLFDKGAAFVTLHKNGELRGCIGSLYPRQAIIADIVSNARSAALQDNRFPPLSADEFSAIQISVSLLSGYEKIDYKNEDDLMRQLNPYIDGIVIRDGNRQGLFLPSVWKQFPDKKEFLNNLKLKAGMSPSFWSNDIAVYRFRTVEIKENENQ